MVEESEPLWGINVPFLVWLLSADRRAPRLESHGTCCGCLGPLLNVLIDMLIAEPVSQSSLQAWIRFAIRRTPLYGGLRFYRARTAKRSWLDQPSRRGPAPHRVKTRTLRELCSVPIDGFGAWVRP
jgi:hypothetical protein